MIRPGDTVKILNEKAEGIIKKLLSNGYALVMVGDFEYMYPLDHVIAIDGNDPVTHHPAVKKIHPKIKEIISEKEIPPAKKKVQLKKSRKGSHITEIDLHGHEIIEESKGIHKSKILDYQLDYFIRELNNAIARKERTIIFIHGKGEGILKAEIRKILSSRENLVFYDAPLKYYGGGATQVDIIRF